MILTKMLWPESNFMVVLHLYKAIDFAEVWPDLTAITLI